MVGKTGLPPGPKASAWRQAIGFGADPFGYLEQCYEKFGTIFTLRLPGDPPRVVISDPEDIKKVFALPAEAFDASVIQFPINIGEDSMLFLNGDRHKRERKLLRPPFHGRQLRSYGELMRDVTTETLASWEAGQTINQHPVMQHITLSIIIQCVFGIIDQERHDRLKSLVIHWLNGVMSPQVFLAGTLLTATRVRHFLDNRVGQSLRSQKFRKGKKRWMPWSRMADAKASIISMLQEEIVAYRANPDHDRNDVLAMLLETRDEGGEPMDEAHIIDELMTTLVAGHETTANSILWALYYILPRKDVVQKIQQELNDVFGDGPVDVDKQKELVYLEACIHESMRLSPIAVAVSRNITKEMTLGGYQIPPKTVIWPCTYITQRRPELWGDAKAFDPTNFLEGNRPNANMFFPFGGGKRRCIGAVFAMYEMRIILAELFTRADMELAPGTKATPSMRGISVVPKDGLNVNIRKILRPIARPNYPSAAA